MSEMNAPTTHLPHRSPPGRGARFAMPIGVFVLSVACFLPTLRNGFVNWDDPGNFLTNPAYQSFAWTAVKWALTTRHMGHYQPLNWLTFMADHALAGVVGPTSPRADDDSFVVKLLPKTWPNQPPSAGRFHQTQVILHGVAAVLVFYLARRLLNGSGDHGPTAASQWAAAFAALLFSLHPLRVESVAWASARTDVLAAIFMLAAVLAYLKGLRGRPPDAGPSPRVRVVVALFMALALCSKIMAVTLPVVLLIFDIYLGRLARPSQRHADAKAVGMAPDPTAWPNHWTGLLPRLVQLGSQKAELFALAIGGFLVARWAHAGAIANLEMHSLSKRLAQLPVSLAFYPYKTLVPTNLSPLYEFPVRFGWTHPQVLASSIGILLAFIILYYFFKRYRSPWAAVAAYIVLILPVSGLTQRGPQMVADRYSYISCIPLALLTAGLINRLAQSRGRAVAIGAMLPLVFCFIQTQRQIHYWRDSKLLWQRAIELDRTNATAYACLGAACDSAGMPDRALELYQKSVAIRHTQPDAWFSLGNLHRARGNDAEAIRCYLTELENQPGHAQARMNLCLVLARQDRLAEAEPHLRILVADPARSDDTLVRHMLADACADRGAFAEAVRLLDDAIAIARRKNLPGLVDDLVPIRNEYAGAATSRPEEE